ncbi:MAG: nitrogenase-stabilizing/protective protein NifW [Gammaproteobacteria bacterium]
MTDLTLDEQMEELSSAEDFLDFFELEYDARVVHVNRLHILQRYHDYLAQAEESDSMPEPDEARKVVYGNLLARAYLDFVDSDAKTEKVLKIYKMQGPQESFVPLDELFGAKA